MKDFKIYKKLEDVFLNYNIRKENQDLIYRYLDDEIKEDRLIELIPEEPYKDQKGKYGILNDLFQDVLSNELLYEKILKAFYYLYRTDIHSIGALREQINGFLVNIYFGMENVLDKIIKKLKKYSLPAEYYVASYLSSFQKGWHLITAQTLKDLECLYEIDKNILYEAWKHSDYYGQRYIELCLLLKDGAFKKEFRKKNIDLFLMFYEDKDKKELEKYLTNLFKTVKIDFDKLVSTEFYNEHNIRILTILTYYTFKSMKESRRILKFFIEKDAVEFFNMFHLCFENDIEDTYLMIGTMLKELKLNNSIFAEYIIKRYSDYKYYEMVKGYEILFKLNKRDVLEVIDKLDVHARYVAYGILARNEGGKFIDLFQREFMDMLDKTMFAKVDPIYYDEFEAYVGGRKDLVDTKSLAKDLGLYHTGIKNMNMLVVMLVENPTNISRKILAYMIYGEKLVDRSFLLDKMINITGFDMTLSIIKSLDIESYMLIKIITSLRFSYHMRSKDKRIEEAEKEVKLLMKNSIKDFKDRAFNKGEFKVEELKFLIEKTEELYSNQELSKDDYREILLKSASNTSKTMTECLLNQIKKLRDEDIVIELLNSKKAVFRRLGALGARENRSPKIVDKLKSMMEKEKSSRVKDIIMTVLENREEGNKSLLEDDIFNKKVNKRVINKLSWIKVEDMPKLKHNNGEITADDYKYNILNEYSKLTNVEIYKNKDILKKNIDLKSLSVFTYNVLERWIESGAEAKKKWILSLAADFGGLDTIAVLEGWIKKWSDNHRIAMAVFGVKSLALNGRDEALFIVDSISRKFKYNKVKTSAREYMALAAESLGITKEELEDRLISDLGFDKYGKKELDYGSRKITLELDLELNIRIIKEEGKVVKSLPRPNKKDDPEKAEKAKEEFRLIKKHLKAMVKAQTERLDYALSSIRLWKFKDWKKVFVDNVIMQKFAISLVWGIYDDKGLNKAFRYMDDGSFVDIDEEDIDIEEDYMIGLVHPVEMDKNDLEAWEEQLEDYEITQPIEQLGRKVFKPNEDEGYRILRFTGIKMNDMSLLGKMTKYGWLKGSVQDAGMFYEFYKEIGDVGVQLHTSGLYVGGGFEDVVLKDMIFYVARTIDRGSYIYDSVKEGNILKVENIDKRLFSEIIYDMTRVTENNLGKVET